MNWPEAVVITAMILAVPAMVIAAIWADAYRDSFEEADDDEA